MPQRSEGRVAGALRALALVHFGSLVVPPSLPQRLLGRAALSTMSSSEAGGDLKAEKQALRKELRGRLAALDDAAILRQSEAVSRQLFALPEYAQSTGVACFLSMPKEFNTRPILARLFEDGKRVYLPRVESVKEHTMSMLEASSLADIDSFPPSRWGIPEPAREGPTRLEALEDGSASPPHIGGALVQQLTHEGFLFAGTVGLREDLKSVKAMMQDPLWDVPGGWKDKTTLELDMVINQKKALVPVSHRE